MATGSNSKRITKELGTLTSDPEPGIKVELENESSLFDWKITLDGPEDSPYAGGSFKLRLHLADGYPFKPPTVNFATKIYHPNVSNDDKGTMCLGILRPDEWKPSSKIVDVLRFARQLLSEPNPDDAVEQTIAREYKEDKPEYIKKATEWTKKYAK